MFFIEKSVNVVLRSSVEPSLKVQGLLIRQVLKKYHKSERGDKLTAKQWEKPAIVATSQNKHQFRKNTVSKKYSEYLVQELKSQSTSCTTRQGETRHLTLAMAAAIKNFQSLNWSNRQDRLGLLETLSRTKGLFHSNSQGENCQVNLELFH